MERLNGIMLLFIGVFCVLPILKVVFLSIFLWDALDKFTRK